MGLLQQSKKLSTDHTVPIPGARLSQVVLLLKVPGMGISYWRNCVFALHCMRGKITSCFSAPQKTVFPSWEKLVRKTFLLLFCNLQFETWKEHSWLCCVHVLYAHIHTLTHAYIYICIYTYPRTHTHTRSLPRFDHSQSKSKKMHLCHQFALVGPRKLAQWVQQCCLNPLESLWVMWLSQPKQIMDCSPKDPRRC